MKGKIWNRGLVIGSWFLLSIFIIFGLMYLSSNRTLYIIICIGAAIWLLINIKDYGFKWSFSFDEDDSTVQTNNHQTTVKSVSPYPMNRSWNPNVTNGVRVAFDCCCEFCAFCKGIIPSGVCTPDPFECSVSVDSSIGISFSWKTNYYSLDSLLEEKGYSLGEGFLYSDNSGLVVYTKTIQNDEIAMKYLCETPDNVLLSELTTIAKNNLIGLPPCSVSGRVQEFPTYNRKTYTITIN